MEWKIIQIMLCTHQGTFDLLQWACCHGNTFRTNFPHYMAIKRSAWKQSICILISNQAHTLSVKRNLSLLQSDAHLKHKDSFGKSENLSKIFFAEILVFDHDYEGKSSSSNGLLWISFIYFFIIYLNSFSNCSEGLRTYLYTLSTILCKCNYYQTVNLTSVQSVKVVQKYFG